MRVFHLLPTKWGLESIQRKRIRISRFSNLNDPFELLGAMLKDTEKRAAFRQWKRQVSEKYGLVCFSKCWSSPLLWSHYGERHRGLCLGFDVPDEKVVQVRYQDARIELADDALDEAAVMQFLSTKFVEWSYEREVRLITDLTDMDPADGNFYVDFYKEFDLKEVIVGALGKISRETLVTEIEKAELDISKISLIKARLAVKSYAIVEDKRGLQ